MTMTRVLAFSRFVSDIESIDGFLCSKGSVVDRKSRNMEDITRGKEHRQIMSYSGNDVS